MVLQPRKTTVAYRCPHCGAGVISAVDPFLLGGAMVRLKCDCGESAMEIAPNGDKVRLTVPCILCPNPHRFTVSKTIFYGKDLFSIPCPYADVNICMMGEQNHVRAELARTELELLDRMEESGVSDLSALHENAAEALPDPQVLEIVLFVIRDLDDEGKITCRCDPADNEREYDAEILPEGVRVTCKKCGASTLVPTNSLLDAHEFLNCDALHLT